MTDLSLHKPGEVVTMRVHDDPTHIMTMLTDMYSDTALAVIREYSTNALDAMVFADKWGYPIEVFLPNLGPRRAEHPVFRVVDHGNGLSVDDIIGQYTSYGYSSKQGDEDMVGMLGLGCKAALTFATKTFTVRSVHDGVEAVVLIKRESAVGTAEIVSLVPTTDESGVEVTVPVPEHMVEDFNQTALNFYQYWEVGTIEVDGLEPEFIFDQDGVRKLDDDVALVKDDRDYVVMGSVAYPVDEANQITESSWRRETPRCVARVPIGSVDFTPSRESLMYTPLTKDTLATLKNYVKAKAFRAAQAEIAAAPNRLEALKVAESWRNMGFSKYPFSYQADVVPSSFSFGRERCIGWSGTSTSDKASRKNGAWQLEPERAARYLHVLGYHARGVAPTTKEKVMQWLDTHKAWTTSDGRFDGVMFYASQPDEMWLPAERVVQYSEIQAIKLPKAARQARSATPNFRVLDANGDEHHLETWGGSRRKVVMESTNRDKHLRSALGSYSQRPGVNAAVFLATPASIEKFIAKTGAMPVKDWAALEAERAIVGVSVDALYLNNAWDSRVMKETEAAARLGTVLDPSLEAFLERIRIARTDTFDWEQWYQVSQICRMLDVPDMPEMPNVDSVRAEANRFLRKYPALAHLDKDQRLEYVNAMYSYRQA